MLCFEAEWVDGTFVVHRRVEQLVVKGKQIQYSIPYVLELWEQKVTLMLRFECISLFSTPHQLMFTLFGPWL